MILAMKIIQIWKRVMLNVVLDHLIQLTASLRSESSVAVKKKKTRPRGHTNLKPLQPDEIAVIFDYLNNHYDEIIGKKKCADYKTERTTTWMKFVANVNAVFDGKYQRTAEKITKFINNLKSSSEYKFDFLSYIVLLVIL